MKKSLVTLLLFITISSVKSQKIEIGMDSRDVKQIIEQSTNQRTGYDSYGNLKSNNTSWDVKYYDGQISNVIQCYENQFLYDFNLSTSFCRYYVMENNRLSYILTQYAEISIEKLKTIYDESNQYTKSGELYFSDDYKYYSKIYLAKNGQTTVEWGKANLNQLSDELRTKIQNKRNAEWDAKRVEIAAKKAAEKEELELSIKRLKKKKEVGLKIYDLKEYPVEYNLYINELRSEIIKELISLKDSLPYLYFTLNNTYYVHYKLFDNSNYSEEFQIIGCKKNITLVSGSEEYYNFMERISPKLPTWKEEGYFIMTELKDTISFYCERGETIVKIKDGLVDFIGGDTSPTEKVQKLLVERLKNVPKGKYTAKYRGGDVMGESFLRVFIHNNKNPIREILKKAP